MINDSELKSLKSNNYVTNSHESLNVRTNTDIKDNSDTKDSARLNNRLNTTNFTNNKFEFQELDDKHHHNHQNETNLKIIG